MNILAVILFALADIIPYGSATLQPLQERDSILIADQFNYGFRIEGVEDGSIISPENLAAYTNDTLVLVRGWQLDTLKESNGKRDISGHVVVAPFGAGDYKLPEIKVGLTRPNGKTDTLVFNPVSIQVKTMPVDTATFVINDLKGQMKYPLTFAEVLPWIVALIFLLVAIRFIFPLLRRLKTQEGIRIKPSDPPHIVALKALEQYRNEKYWAAEKQKAYYSGLTDILKNYIEGRYGIDAPEMTTDELFDALKDCEIEQELYSQTLSMFELADLVKFAKYVAQREENVNALTTAMDFVTATHTVEEPKEGQKEDVL